MPVENSVEGLKDFIASRTREKWESSKEPYQLAHISPELRKEGVEYKPLVLPETLKNFIQNSMAEQVKVIVHPKQRAKVVVVPPEADYSFDVPIQTSFPFRVANQRQTEPDFDSAEAMVNFLKALSRLPEDGVKSVVITVNVIVHLMSGQLDWQ